MSYDNVYEFDRGTTPEGEWLIPNPARVNTSQDDCIHRPANEIETALPQLDFIFRCDGDKCYVCFKDPLDAAQKATLAAVIRAHKDNT